MAKKAAARRSKLAILALDPATQCGWAHSNGKGGVWDLSVQRDESVGLRLLRFKGHLLKIQDTYGVSLVAYEAARHARPGMQGALVVQAEIQGVLKEWCETEGIDYRAYSPKEVKKFATGNGNADKAAMLREAQRKWGKSIKDHNEADARHILAMIQHELHL